MKRTSSVRTALSLLGTATLAVACASTAGLAREDASADAPAESAAPDVAALEVVAPPPPDVVSPPAPDVLVVDAAVDAPPDAAPACNITFPPNERTAVISRDPTGAPLVYVARRVDFGAESRASWGRHGLDRDGLCTGPARPYASCRPRGTTTAPEDGFDGRDNSFAPRMMPALASEGWTEEAVSNGIASGASSFALRITEYGGGDDRTVGVEVLPVIHGHRPGDPVSRPAFDGRDVWHVNRRVAYDPGAPGRARVYARRGFAFRDELWADLPSGSSFTFAGVGAPLTVTLSAIKLFAPLARNEDNGATTLGPVEVAGIWPLRTALTDLAARSCFDYGPRHLNLTSALQGAADIMDTLELAPMTECDAITVGFGMQFVPATLGDDEEDAPPADPCAERGR